jgi:geranylgeranylglycerol-phosphate geranylgeranyltransferase
MVSCYNFSMPTNKIRAILQLFRPDLSLAAGICVFAGQILAAGRLPSPAIGLTGFLCGFALSASAIILNDYFDYEVDLINAPDRPLPSGAITRPEAIVLAVATAFAGLTAAFSLGIPALIVSAIFWLIGFLYNWRFKQSGLPGNLMVCASVAITFILGAMTVQNPWNRVVWTFSLMAFFLDLGEEIAGDAMDMEGDKKRGSRSIALLKGKRFALNISMVLWGLVILLSLVPALLGWLGMVYLIIILVTDALIAFFAIRLLKSQDPVSGRMAMRGIYIGATLGIIAFLAGQFIG